MNPEKIHSKLLEYRELYFEFVEENDIHDICVKLIVINYKINALAKDDY